MEARHGPPTPISCPACGGALWESAESGVVRYACHVGHQYAPDSLLAEHGEAVEQALWTAVRILEQHAELRQRMSARAASAGMSMVAESFADDSRDYHTQAQAIRRLVFGQHDRIEAEPAAERPAGPGAIDWRLANARAAMSKKKKPVPKEAAAPRPRPAPRRAKAPAGIPSERGKRPASRAPQPSPVDAGLTVVGIGASAGGLEAFSQLLRAVTETKGPGDRLRPAPLARPRERAGAAALGADVDARRAGGRAACASRRPRPRHPAQRPDGDARRRAAPVAAAPRSLALHADRLFFASLAEAAGANAIGGGAVGHGQRRRRGLRDIKPAGGITFAQAPESLEVRRHAARRHRDRHGRSRADAAGDRRRSCPTSRPADAWRRRRPPTTTTTLSDRNSCSASSSCCARSAASTSATTSCPRSSGGCSGAWRCTG